MSDEKRFEILLEDISRKMDLLVEGHQSLNQKIDRIATELREEMFQMRGELRAEIIGVRDGLRKEMGEMRDELREEMRQMEDGLRKEMGEMRGELGQKIDKISDRLLNYEKRITALEK
ncbi:hypothetical protein DRJ04_01660 [Candidatus Aerophobetes bacterium]|uniref:DUF1640 domain-containing protein n=1 Tax=Aerophobetes bacterium TaxID=2030807 RepID=A0A662DIT2_UNCAE|nr:MAG: hypothetical protein DRJ04_01660 [Candidatus Aerophobetes bacterium]